MPCCMCSGLFHCAAGYVGSLTTGKGTREPLKGEMCGCVRVCVCPGLFVIPAMGLGDTLFICEAERCRLDVGID